MSQVLDTDPGVGELTVWSRLYAVEGRNHVTTQDTRFVRVSITRSTSASVRSGYIGSEISSR